MVLRSCIFSLVPQLDPTAGLYTCISQVNTNFKGYLKNTTVKTLKLLCKYRKWDSFCYSMIPKLTFYAHSISCDYKK